MKNKTFIKITIYILIIIALSLFRLGFHPGNLTFNPSAKVNKIANKMDKINAEHILSNDDFQLYYIPAADGPTHYSFTKILGIWYCGYYPSKNNITGITHSRNYIYYYGNGFFNSNEHYDYIENEQGDKVYPIKYEANDRVLNIYQITKPKEDKVIYNFKSLNNNVNNETLLNSEVIFYKYENGDDKEFKNTIGNLQREEPDIWAEIEKSIEAANKNEELKDGRIYSYQDDLEYRIIVNYNMGDFLNLEKGYPGYDWSKVVSYDIILKGQYANTISINTTDYSEVSLYKNSIAKIHTYPTTVSKSLIDYFESLK